MRALMKGKAAEFFQKKQKQVEDPEVIMNQIEAKVIAKYIGIDEQQINKYNGFFEQVTKIKLPKGFSRYPSSDKSKIFYVNEMTGDQDTLHPSIDIIKMSFYKMLQDSNSVATFNTKASKLLPFVEEKMVKQCIGLSSKRRDAEKANMQRDQNGKIVMSKLARIKPDMKVLLSTRSYMLKALVEKVYTKKQIWGKGKKANVYAAILASEKGSGKVNQQDEQEMQQTEQTLQQYEKIYTDSKKFYQSKYGEMRYIPQQLKATKSFYRSTPESVLRNLGILNIQKTRMELYWLARLMQCLPLPPEWSTKTGDSFDKFYYEPKKLLFDLHPSYIYVLEQMNSFKLAYQQMDIIHQNYYNNMKEMVFYDYFERQYNVDLYAYVQKMTEIPMTKKKASKKSNQLGKNDWMAVEGIKNSELDVKNAVLIQNILEYWSNLNCKEDNYIPAISPFGQVTWSSTINERTINFCPHAQILKIMVEEKGLDLPRIQQKDLKQFNTIKQQSLSRLQQLIYHNLPEQRQKFLQHFIRNDPKPLSQPYKLPNIYKDNEFYDNIFISPFDLQSDLKFESDNQVPLWLQKVHAKQNSDLYFSLINKNPQKFEDIKQQFTKYSMEMIKKHEPNRQQDIIRVISEIKNNKDLKKFILHINDIDGREERKRLAAIGVVEEEEDSLGSSISQIEMEDQEQEEQSSEDELIDIDASKSDSDDKKEQSEESEDEKIVKVPTQQSKRIQQVSQQQSEPEPEPQKYVGISYKKQPTFQKLSEQELNDKIIALKKQKILKHKYSRSGIKDIVEKMSAQLLRDELHSKQLNDRKKNALISRFQSEHGPYKIKPNLISHKEPRISTALQNGKDKSQQFAPFKSQTSVLGNQQIEPDIRQQQQLIRKRKQQQQNDRKQQKNQDETKQTIQLQPIKRIKPDINEDARLRHISQISELKQFSKVFNQSPSKIKNFKSELLRKTKKSIQQTTATTKFNPQKSISSIESIKMQNGSKNLVSKFQTSKDKLQQLQQQQAHGNRRIFNNNSLSLQKSQSLLHLNNESLSPSKLTSRYNRVCLGNTATNLLSTEPIIRRGQLILLQARKSLISKGRGLETVISKKY